MPTYDNDMRNIIPAHPPPTFGALRCHAPHLTWGAVGNTKDEDEDEEAATEQSDKHKTKQKKNNFPILD